MGPPKRNSAADRFGAFRRRLAGAVFALSLAVLVPAGLAQAKDPQVFDTPEAAAQAILDALATGDQRWQLNRFAVCVTGSHDTAHCLTGAIVNQLDRERARFRWMVAVAENRGRSPARQNQRPAPDHYLGITYVWSVSTTK